MLRGRVRMKSEFSRSMLCGRDQRHRRLVWNLADAGFVNLYHLEQSHNVASFSAA